MNGKIHAGTGKESEEEEVAETVCNELTTTPIPCPRAPQEEEEVENSWAKLSWEKYFKIWIYFLLSNPDFIEWFGLEETSEII